MLKKIELSGFKSFAKKTELTFSTPVTAIVGPNGSGKSNIVEAIRYVLGEQSSKSLRSKSGSDLIFKGSKSISAQNRAIVKITFDNSKKLFRMGEGSTISVDYDEIEISREIFRDGGSVYRINGTEVRLKDVYELLSSVNIGASGHHIISQGEADRILSASARDRREMIEEALGLKLYQYRLRESERKLEKTGANIKEVEVLRREIAPHLRFLKKQVEKVERARELASELSVKYETYLAIERAYLDTRDTALARAALEAERSLEGIMENKRRHEKDVGEDKSLPLRRELEETDAGIAELRSLVGELERALTREETLLEVLRSKSDAPQKPKEGFISIPRSSLHTFSTTLSGILDRAIASDDLSALRSSLREARQHLEGFASKYLVTGGVLHGQEEKTTTADEEKSLSAKLAETRTKLERLREREKSALSRKKELEESIARMAEDRIMRERGMFDLRVAENETKSTLEHVRLEREAWQRSQTLFDEELKEGMALIGGDITKFKHYDVGSISIEDRSEQEERRKYIERLKIKLEEAGAGGSADVLREYEEVAARDLFLSKELDDLSLSIGSINEVIHDLKETIDREFRVGVEKINKAFQDFFSLMFGGGSAFLSVIVEEKKKRRTEEDEETIRDEDEGAFENGIEINISLPQKKVKELMMLSGGERSLTSIALLFAISAVNPPPFLVLDETDAALDEANSRRYGDMIERLAKYSELIVVTHNRETMSRAEVIFGITLGADTASKVLSIKFEEAVKVAK